MPVAPPRPKGPPLNALRAFEAAARLGGFAMAAEELSVTPGAVSQQIRTLEAWAGAPLFTRQTQGVSLTAAGRRLLGPLTLAFDRIGEANHLLRSLHPRPSVNIAALPSVAQLWLQPRLERLRAACPDMDFSVYALEKPPDLTRGQFSLSLFIRRPEDSPHHIALAPCVLAPVCAPKIAERLARGGALADEVLLHDETWGEDWRTWAAAAGRTLPDTSRSPRYSLYSIALADAKAGAGVLMGNSVLAAPDLASGALVAPFPEWVETGRALALELPEAPTPGFADLTAALTDQTISAPLPTPVGVARTISPTG